MTDETAPIRPEARSPRGFMDRRARDLVAERQILTAVERNRRRALIGPDAKVFDLVSRLPAGLYQRAIVRGSKLRR